MPRSTTKTELLKAAETQYSKLTETISSMSEEQRAAPLYFGLDFNKTEAHWGRDKNLRDILVHLHEWHLLLLNWVDSNLAGDPEPFLPRTYTWKSYGQMNEEIWRKHQETPFDSAFELVGSSHRQVVELIESFTDEALFTKAYFDWTGTTSVGSYCVSATSSHYDWALKKIRAHMRAATA